MQLTEHHTSSTMSKEIDVPVLCLDDDDHHLNIDENYKLFRDHLTAENSLLPPFEDDKGESETRNLNLNMFYNNHANRSKRKLVSLEASSAVQESTEDDESLWDVPLFRTLEVIKRDNEARKLAESVAEDDTSLDVTLVRAINKARKLSEDDTLWDVPLVRVQEVINKGRRFIESKVDFLRDVPLVRTKEVIQRDNMMSERMNKKTKEALVDKDYMSYLTWLVDSFKNPTKDLLAKVKVELESWSDDDDIEVSDSPFMDGESTPFVVSKSKNVIDLEKESTEDSVFREKLMNVLEKPYDEGELLLLSGQASMKKRVSRCRELRKGRESSTEDSVFREKLMNVLEKPYDEGELLLLSGQASMKKRVSRCRELRKGRESSYETSELGLSYLEKVCDFGEEYKSVDGDDKARLELLRGFFFYLENVSLPGAFKPWLPENRRKLGRRE